MSTKIQWTQETWNPTVGCNKVSAGCKNCYAIRMAWRLAHIPAMKELYGNTVKKTPGGDLNWTGVVKINEMALEKPFKFKKPTMFFVDSMSDLFHEEVAFFDVDRVFSVMAQCPEHTFQILTKRPERMLEYFSQFHVVDGKIELWLDGMPRRGPWPLPNVWLGVSVEDQEQADKRIPYLLQTPAAVRFLSCEPLLGKIELDKFGKFDYCENDEGMGCVGCSGSGKGECAAKIKMPIDWVICGGESGKGSRPIHPDRVREIKEQCRINEVPFFFKQWGDWAPWEPDAQQPFYNSQHGQNLVDIHGLLPEDYQESPRWDDGLWAIPDNAPCLFERVGKHQAGNMLDGKIYQEFPRVKTIVE